MEQLYPGQIIFCGGAGRALESGRPEPGRHPEHLITVLRRGGDARPVGDLLLHAEPPVVVRSTCIIDHREEGAEAERTSPPLPTFIIAY